MVKIHNPLIEDWEAPDPFMTYCAETGYYYALFTRGKDVAIFRSRHAGNILKDNDFKIIFTPGENGIYPPIWAPELHKAPNGKYYVYTSCRLDPDNYEKRLFVLESLTNDPFEGFCFKAVLDKNMYAIDPTAHTLPDGRQLICYSRVREDGVQILELCELMTPYSLGKRRAVIAEPAFDWEKVPPYDGKRAINEGAYFLENMGRLYIIYSANGCFSDEYCLGVIEYTGGDILNPGNWHKHDRPVLVKGRDAFGPGHASFFRSPDGTEVWCAYHTMKESNADAHPVPRYMNIQKIEFDGNGFPVAAEAVSRSAALSPPSGEKD